METLTLSVVTGGGHLRASHIIESYLLENTTDAEVRVVDALETIHLILDKTIREGYRFLATKTPKMFGLLYQKSNEENPLIQTVPKFNSLLGQQLLPLSEGHQPDVTIVTHPFVAEMVPRLKEKGQVRVPLICITTDYDPHKAWISDNVDVYVVSSEDMVPDMEAMGMRREIAYLFGISVYDVFFDKTDKAALLEELGMKRNRLTILTMVGSFGVSNILQIYEDIVCLNLPFQIIVITGRNEKLFQAFEDKIEEYRLNSQMCCKHIRLVFFTNEAERHMCASNLVITKPGGLMVLEALACNASLAVFSAIPGQEEDNANLLMSRDMAVRIRKDNDCADTISELLSNREKLGEIRQSCQSFDKPQSSKNTLSLIYELVEEQKEDAAAFGKQHAGVKSWEG